MNTATQRIFMWLFGLVMLMGLAVYLMLYHGSTGPLAAPHAEAIRDSSTRSCKVCHAEGGLSEGCKNCHVEIVHQLNRGRGYHAYLEREHPALCEACHPEHLGSDFFLMGAVAWKGLDYESFRHPHVEFKLHGSHEELSCEQCHKEKLNESYALPDFPEYPRTSTFLGLEQDCAACHEDIHNSGDATRTCEKCHDQDRFKPAAFFNHDEYFLLEGVHAEAACAACHLQEESDSGTRFGPVRGRACIDCHESPHHAERIREQECLACHLAADESWAAGRRGIDPPMHTAFGFELKPPHADRECEACHRPEDSYAERFPDPEGPNYLRRPDQCQGCHADPHGGQFMEKYSACLECHRRDRFFPSIIGPAQHSITYPLQGSHQAVACNQCHTVDPQLEVRRFAHTPTACKDCHSDPHGTQFGEQLRDGDCTVCHFEDSSTFRIHSYTHQGSAAFFLGQGHRQAACRQCHVAGDDNSPVLYQSAPTECAACHADIHRGQFMENGMTACARCHDTTEQWSAGAFVHDRDADFSLEAAHAKVSCVACHIPVPQPDGMPVVQYKPLTTRCEDCHGFISE